MQKALLLSVQIKREIQSHFDFVLIKSKLLIVLGEYRFHFREGIAPLFYLEGEQRANTMSPIVSICGSRFSSRGPTSFRTHCISDINSRESIPIASNLVCR